MKPPSLFTYVQELIAEATLQQSYDLIAHATADQASGRMQSRPQAIKYRIKCGITQCRLKDDSTTVPTNIERCV